MLRNYLTVAVRNLTRSKVHSVINISGLAIGIGCSLLLALFVYLGLSHDRFHEKFESIYRVARKDTAPNGKVTRLSLKHPSARPHGV